MCTRSSGFTEEDIVPDDFDDLSDEKTIQILAGHGSRASPFVSRGRAYLDKVQKILIDQEVPRRVESQIMKEFQRKLGKEFQAWPSFGGFILSG